MAETDGKDEALRPAGKLHLDYGSAASRDLLRNLSGIACHGDDVWTVSDEGRTLEHLRRDGDGFRLHRQHRLGELFDDIPGKDGAELDLEAIAIDGRRLWLCGSHARVREKQWFLFDLLFGPRIEARKSRRFLAALTLDDEGRVTSADSLPFTGKGSLRKLLEDDPLLAPYLDLPSKENGFDIEGLAVSGETVWLGLRGPVIDERALVVRVDLDEDLAVRDYDLVQLDLGGLGIRDMAPWQDDLLLLAGPMGEDVGPYRLHRWRGTGNEAPPVIGGWPSGIEKPEGMAHLADGAGAAKLVVVYDSPADARLTSTGYTADLFSLDTAD